jgi:hypothetical protein
MKLRIAIATLTLAALASPVPAVAAGNGTGNETCKTASVIEFSAETVKKKRPNYVRVPAEPRRSGWRGADPSFGPDGRPYPRPTNMGDCVVDMGYGRWIGCENR